MSLVVVHQIVVLIALVHDSNCIVLIIHHSASTLMWMMMENALWTQTGTVHQTTGYVIDSL